MPARLVYAPKAYVFTKNASGAILNLTPYVTAGQVQRLIGQASTAKVSLRNPQRRFTIPKTPSFHPMDPITIFLERLRGYPVQVFTGYLDDTPYYQMFPGTITLQATCTLKRLMFTYWDPSLPYVNAFLQKYGWINDNGSLKNVPALSTQPGVAKGGALQDGSIGKLLWAILTDIGDWHDTNIWIEKLPSGPNGIANRMALLMSQLAADEANAAQEFEAFMNTAVGSSSYGNGGTQQGGSGGVPSTLSGDSVAQKSFNYFVQQGLPPQGAAGLVGNFKVEAPGGPGEAQGGGSIVPSAASGLGFGLAQWGGSRLTALEAMATQAGKPVGDLGVQLAFCWHELNTSYTDVLAALRAAKSPGDAATVVCLKYEAPADPNATLNQRIQYANDAYTSFASGSVVGTSSLGATFDQGTTSVTNPFATTSTGGTAGTGKSDTNANANGNDVVAVAQGALARQQQQRCFHYSKQRPIQYDLQAPSVYIDCSGFALACYKAAGLPDPSNNNYNGAGYTGDMIPNCTKVTEATAEPGDLCFYGPSESATEHVTVYVGNGQAISMGSEGDPSIGSAPQMGPPGFLGYYRPKNSPGGTGGANGTGAVAGAAGNALSQSNAQAFTAELNFPSIMDMTVAMILGNAHKGLMHDQQLLPFVQQLTQASLRQFQSLPNGDFFAFYPDYFGETDHRKPYWNIDDIEVLDGGINLNDQSLVTHQFAVGDNTYPVNNELINMLFSAGTITVFNAFMDPSAVSIKTSTDRKGGGMVDVMTQAEAVEFVKRYGARPQVSNYPMVRSPLYEMFLAYQQFLLAWANQFRTPFRFTFMPEVYPGGKVAFPNHGLQMYVNSVTHSWDYEEGGGGFTTDAVLSAPAAMAGTSNPDLPPNMVQALVGPVRTAAQLTSVANQGKAIAKHGVLPTTSKDTQNAIADAPSQVTKVTDQTIQNILGSL